MSRASRSLARIGIYPKRKKPAQTAGFWANRINTNMKQKPKKNLQHVVDDALYNELVQLGIVKSWSDFSRQCRKNETYAYSMSSKKHGIHVGSLVFLAVKLTGRIARTASASERARLRLAAETINRAVKKKCELREEEYRAAEIQKHLRAIQQEMPDART